MRRIRRSIRVVSIIALLAWLGLTAWVLVMAWRADERILHIEASSIVVVAWLALTPLAWIIAWGIRSPTGASEPTYYRTLSEKSGDALLVYAPNGEVVWRNIAARNLFPDHTPMPSNVGVLANRVQQRGTMVKQVVPVNGAGRYNVQALPVAEGHTAVIIRTSNSDGGRSRFYENFIQRIVHDMRNPLAAIIGHAANLRSITPADGEQVERSATTIEQEARRLARLIDSMLFDARLAYVPLAPESLDLVELVEEAMYTLEEQTANTSKQIALEMPSRVAEIEGDRDLLVRAFENLLDNGLKYTGDDGRILVRLEARPDGHHLSFIDNGTGIPPEFLPDRIFEPLVRATTGHGGSGLGLSIVKKIVEMHGGTIRAESTVGKGTIITIYLPAHLGGL